MVQTDLQLVHHADFLSTLDNFIGIVIGTIGQEGCCGIHVFWDLLLVYLALCILFGH